MLKQTQLFFALIALVAPLASCTMDNDSASEIFSQIYFPDNIPTQVLTIDAGRDNIIKGERGTRIRIAKNTFVDSLGQVVTGEVEILLKEILTPQAMILANMTTTFEGKALETGGMIYINALSKDKEVSIASGKEIQVSVPADTALPGMSLFEGQQEATGVKWLNPVPIPDKVAGDTLRADEALFVKSTNATTYMVSDVGIIPDTVSIEVNRMVWEGNGLKIREDSIFKIAEYTVTLYRSDSSMTWEQTFEQGTNTFAEDSRTSYIFSVKKLGWANIDRLLSDPRTKEVDLITAVENHDDFKHVYVTLVTQNMHLPGYQKKDETYSFSHGDEEKQQLPVGETATIIATAYRNETPWFAIKKITITEKQTVSFKLEESTTEQLKAELEAKI